tara:strand:+ start:978 stop:3962 length:2985 start_codon:yes stop_codon:yes gene_type:complete
MVQYNKYIITKKKENPLAKLEKKYGKIISYNYTSIKEYNDLSTHFFEKKDVKGGETTISKEEESTNSSYAANRGKKRKYKIKKYEKLSRLTIKQRMQQMKFVAYICLGILILNTFTNILYIWKLNGIIYPILIIVVITNLYIICKSYLDIISNRLSQKKGTIIQKIHNAINLFVGAIRGLPGIIPSVPNLPMPSENDQPFKGIRKGIQLLIIDVDIDVNKYKIEINIPSMAFDFINPLAAICCAWDGFMALIQPIIDSVIKPFINVCKKIYTPIKKAIMWAKTNIIDPVINVVMKIYRAIMKFINFIIGIFMDIMSAFEWIPGLGAEISDMRDKWNNDKKKQKLKKKLIKEQEVRQGKAYFRDKKASEAAMAKANKDNAALIAAEAGELSLDDALERARRWERMTPEERKEMLKNMSAEERKVLQQGLKMLKMTEKELEEYCNQELKKLIPLRHKKLTWTNLIPKAVDHVMRNPDTRFEKRKRGGQNDKIHSNVKIRENKHEDKWTRDFQDEINLCIYNAEKCSEGCKKTFDIENTNITGFVRTFHILKKRYLADLNRQDRILFKLKTVKLRNKIKYHDKKCKNIKLNNIKNNMVRCVKDYAINMVKDVAAKCKEVHKCSRRLVKLHTVLELQKKYPKKYGGILNKKNLKILKKHNLKSCKLIGGWSIPNPWDILKAAMNALLDGVRELCKPLDKAFKAVLDAIAAIPSILTGIINIISKATNIPQIFKKISSGIKFVVNWIADQVPALFKVIGTIIKNIAILCKWFITEVIGRGLRIIMAIVEFIIELIKATAKAAGAPGWATKDNPILKIPNVLEYIVKILDLPFKDFFETIGNIIKGILKAIPIDFILTPLDSIKSVAESFVNGVKVALDIVIGAVRGAISAAGKAVSFFGGNIYSLVPCIRTIMEYPARPDNSVRARQMARRKRAFEKQFKDRLDVYTTEIENLIDRQREYRLARNKDGYKNITILLKRKAAERDRFKRDGYKQIKRMRI